MKMFRYSVLRDIKAYNYETNLVSLELVRYSSDLGNTVYIQLNRKCYRRRIVTRHVG